MNISSASNKNEEKKEKLQIFLTAMVRKDDLQILMWRFIFKHTYLRLFISAVY